MTRYKKYIETNVYDEAKKRLHHIYDTHDSVVVAFSGGKDSLTVLHLCKEVAEERGLSKVHVVFRDEELINKVVIDFVRKKMLEPWVDLKWWAVPLESHKYILGHMTDFIQWQPGKRWVREKPEWALTEKDLGIPEDSVLSQYSADEVAITGFAGKVCIITGIRSAESLMRFRSSVNKLNENYINKSGTPRATLGRPIFDWEENDVFKYFYDNKIAYCPIYDWQTWAGKSLRVASAINSEAAREFDKLKAVDPDLYEAIIDIHPDMIMQGRYFKELDRKSVVQKYAGSWDSILEWILENIKGTKQRNKALEEYKSVRTRAGLLPEQYPLDYVLKSIMNEGGKRRILPLKVE